VDFQLIDCQMSTTHLASLGAREIPRSQFVREVSRLVRQSATRGRWSIEQDLVQSL